MMPGLPTEPTGIHGATQHVCPGCRQRVFAVWLCWCAGKHWLCSNCYDTSTKQDCAAKRQESYA